MNNKFALAAIVCFIMCFLAIDVLSLNDLQCGFFLSTTSCPSGAKLIGVGNDTGGINNAHAENYTFNNYTNSICCNNSNPSIIIGNSCGTVVVRLNDSNNTHVEIGSNSNYSFAACLNSSARYLTCSYPTNTSGGCSAGQVCVMSIAGSEGVNSSNAHVGNCSSYDQLVCCGYTNSPPVISTASIIPETTAYYNSNLTGFCNATDADTDNVVYNYIWYKNNISYYTDAAFRNGSMTVGVYHACGIRSNDSRVLCWGYNFNGQLGDSSNSNRWVPTLTSNNSPFMKISAGGYHTCGIRANDSRVLCWGSNSYGQLGDNTSIEKWSPVLIRDPSPYLAVSAGNGHTCGIRANDSRVLCWGRNDYSQLGDNTNVQKNISTLTSDATPYLAISAGLWYSCGIRANDSRVLCWGYNYYGQLGDNTTTTRWAPTLIKDESPYLAIAAGTTTTCGIRANDSRVLCWGYNLYGAIGDNTTVSKNISTPTKDTSKYMAITANSHVCGIRANDSRVLCWGRNSYGQLGDNSNISKNISTLINDTSPYLAIGVGAEFSCGIRANDSRVLCWGRSDYGQIGDNTLVQKNISTLTTDNSSYAGRFNQSVEISIPFNITYLFTTPGQNWTLSCRAMDYTEWGLWFNSSETTILANRAPSNVTLLYPANGNYTVFERMPNFTWTQATDPDNDAVHYDLNVSCASSCPSNCQLFAASLTGTNYTPTTSLCADTPYNWTVNACDVNDSCNKSVSFSFNITSVLDLVLLINETDFGTMAPLETKTTTASTATPPLIVRNTGNVFCNVTVNATALFLTDAMDTNKYQFNVTDNETSSYNPACSQTSFANMSNTAKIAFCNLSWVDAGDEGRLNLNITIPAAEPPIARNSSIYFNAVKSE